MNEEIIRRIVSPSLKDSESVLVVLDTKTVQEARGVLASDGSCGNEGEDSKLHLWGVGGGEGGLIRIYLRAKLCHTVEL